MESLIIDEVRAEKKILELLRFVFWKEPTRELLLDFLNASLIEEENDIDRGLNLMNRTVRSHEDQLDSYLEDLAIEFTRLFLGPANPVAVPFGSFYLSETKRLMTDETIEIRKRYLDAGVAAKFLHSVPDDHISTELEFLALVAQDTISLSEEGERLEASRKYEIMHDFMVNHLALWAPAFAKSIIEDTNEDFFRGAAITLQGFVSLSS